MLRNFLENCASLDLTQKPLAKKAHLESPQQQSKGETSSRGGLHLLSFPNKLWRIVNSDKFKALRWDSGGVYLVVDVEMFPKEFLDCKERPRVFETNSTKGFLRLLNLYGFRKVKYAQERSASLSAFLEEENELSKGNKLLFFYNPSFQRGCEHRLHHMARRVRIKAGKVDGGAEKPGAGVEDGSEETAAASFQEGDRGAETYSGLKCE
ncbi:heat shock transcription factor, X-linked-like, partial [Arapaima gigas]